MRSRAYKAKQEVKDNAAAPSITTPSQHANGRTIEFLAIAEACADFQAEAAPFVARACVGGTGDGMRLDSIFQLKEFVMSGYRTGRIQRR